MPTRPVPSLVGLLCVALAGGVTGCLSGCIVEAPSASGGAWRQGGEAAATPRAATASPERPALQVRSGAVFGGRVEVLGATLSPGRVQPGDQVRVSLMFRVLEPVPDDYLVFVHVEDAEGRGERLNADHPPAGGRYPTSQWKKGETVRDDFTFYVPATSTARNLTVWFGLWQAQRDARLPVTNPAAVRHDGKDRVLLAQVPVG